MNPQVLRVHTTLARCFLASLAFLCFSVSECLAQEIPTSVYQLKSVEERLTDEYPVFFSLTDEVSAGEEVATADATEKSTKGNVTIISLPRKREASVEPEPLSDTSPSPHGTKPSPQKVLKSAAAPAQNPPPSSEKVTSDKTSKNSVNEDETTQKPSNGGAITADEIENRRKQTAGSELTAEQRTQVETHFQQAAKLVKLAEETRQKAVALKTKTEQSPKLIAELKAKLEKPSEKINLPDSVDEAELAQQIASTTHELSDVESKLKAFESDAKARSDRKTALASMVEDLKKRLSETEANIASLPSSGGLPSIVLAHRTELEALSQLLKSQMELVPVEQSYNATFADGFVLQRDLAQRSKKNLLERLEKFENLQANLRQAEIRKQAAAARKAVQEAHPALRTIAERNAELTKLRSELTQALKKSEADVESTKKILETIQSKIENAKNKEERTGLTTSIGLLLRNEKYHLPDVAEYKLRQKAVEQDILQLHEQLIALEDERETLGDIDEKAEEILVSVRDTPTKTPNNVEMQEMVLELLTTRRQYLTDLIHDYESQLETQVELSTLEKTLIAEVGTFREYIDQRILWVRSTNMAGVTTLQAASQGAIDLFAISRWTEVAQTLGATVASSPISSSGLGLLMLALIVLQGFFIRRISKLGQNEAEHESTGLSGTLWSFLLTGLVAMVWPALLWIVGREMRVGSNLGEFSYIVGEALQFTAILFFSVELLRQICRPGGLAECHLDWPQDAVRSLHRKLIGLLVASLPLVFTFRLAGSWQDGQWADSVGRLAFIGAMVWFCWNLHRMLQPGGTILQAFAKKVRAESQSWVATLCYISAVAAPLVLAGLAFVGYQYTAEQLFLRLELTLWLAITLLVTSSLFMRSVSKAHAGIARLRDRLHTVTHRGLDAHKVDTELTDTDEEASSEEELVSFAEQSRKFSRVASVIIFLAGNWIIWGEVLPALDRVSGIELWWTTMQVVESVAGESGTQLVPTTKSVPITLGHLLVSIGLIVLTSVAAGNVPMFLELTLLKRMPLDPGARHAVTTLFRYAIAVVGMVFAAKTIGIGWSNVQWLVAALTVGLGFGLQEIFANFVSGLIILFERPIRIGDVVTIDGVSGTVSRIQIRATTIRDFDKKEYLVPNKEFVTGRLLNWTLSDKVNRVVINVGIAYGSDPDQARTLMLQVANDNPRVLDDPAPIAGFEGFGDSSLNLVLRCHLPDLDNRLDVISELHTEINQAFNKHGIEIPFPQMDLHVKDTPVSQESDGGLRKAA